jgi:hypothetical protein
VDGILPYGYGIENHPVKLCYTESQHNLPANKGEKED